MAVTTEFGRFNALQLPPDSSGKKMALLRNVVVEYTGDAVNQFEVGDLITGVTSGFVGNITSITGNKVTGQFSALSIRGTPTFTPTVGETLTVGGTSYGTIASLDHVYIGGNVVVSGDNPFNHGKIDNLGAQFVRFTEGEQQLAAFGESKVAASEQLAAYLHFHGVEAGEWYDNVSGAGSLLSHLSDESSVALDVGTVSGGIAERTTHRYHVYQPGFGQLTSMTVTVGDAGKANVRRRWGIFDDNNGLFFELDGLTLYVVQRTSTSGSPVDTRVAQADWEHDRADGTGGIANPSSFTLDVASNNIYWIDYQWLGAGRVRFGCFLGEGERAVLHSFHNVNSAAVPWCTSPVLPIRWGVENTGVAASPSRIKLTCAQVSVEGKLTPELSRRSVKWDSDPATVAPTTAVPAISFRAAALINSIRNNKSTIPEKLTAYVKAEPCRVSIYSGHTLTGSPSWAAPQSRTDVAVEVDTAAAGITGGIRLISWVLPVGCHDVDMPDNFGLLGLCLRLLADDAQTLIFTVMVESLEAGATTVEVTMTGIDL